MSPVVRPVGPYDLEIVAALHGACFEDAWSVQAVAELMAMPGTFGLIAAVASPAEPQPAGFLVARVAAEECEILSIGVVPTHRRRGLARLLMDRATRSAAAEGAGHVFLEVAEDNWGAQRLYAVLGFAPVGRRRNYYRRGRVSIAALTLRRMLGAGGRA